VLLVSESEAPEREAEVFTRSLLSQFEQYVQLGKKVPAEVLSSLNGIDEPGRLVDTMAAHMATANKARCLNPSTSIPPPEPTEFVCVL